MIRISQICEPATCCLIVEGTLSGAFVDELEKCWLEATTARCGDQLRVDLAGVSYIDDRGRQLLKRIFDEGAELRATGVMTRGIIEEIIGGADSSQRI